jgi:hypothetical protein
MPQIIALRPGVVAGADLGGVTFQLGLGAVVRGDDICFALLYSYPATSTGAFRPADSLWQRNAAETTALVAVPIALAESQEELQRISVAAYGSGSDDTDQKRLTEAFEMFKNRSRTVSQPKLDACVRDASAVVAAYARVRQWMAEGMTKPESIKVMTSYAQRDGQTMETVLLCRP